MGLMNFLVPDRAALSEDSLAAAHMTGMDGIPWQCRVVATGNGLMVDRPAGDSGNFHIPWAVAGHGTPTLSTASLMERMRPYVLAVELARGTLNRLRNHTAAWQSLGMAIPTELAVETGFAQEAFFRAASQQQDIAESSSAAQESLRHALNAIELLCASYAAQALDARHHQTPRLTTLFGARLDHELLDNSPAKSILPAFNAVQTSVAWAKTEPEDGRWDWRIPDAQIQWSMAQGYRVVAGPIFEPSLAALPQWLYLWENDLDRLLSFVTRQVEQVVSRYTGHVHLWHVAARVNTAEPLPIDDDAKVRLMISAVETVRRLDQRTPMVVSFDQPWCERLIRSEPELSALHFADALIRADLGVAGLALEINLGYSSEGTLPRDLIAVNQQIDRWSMFGLPLIVMLTAPSAASADPIALAKCKCLGGRSGVPDAGSQVEIAQRLVPLLLAKQSVQGVFWNQLQDARPHDFPHGGLIDAAGNIKPVVGALAAIRQQHLV
jgi:hypothetical protein